MSDPQPADTYHVRPYESADRDDVSSLYGTVTGTSWSNEWIDWKFTQSPYVDNISMFVAETDNQIIGIRPYHVVPLRSSNKNLLAGYFQNVMVHPDHRDEGVFSQLSQHTIDHLAEQVSLLFCLTNMESQPIYAHWGWTPVTTVQTYYRPQNPATLMAIYQDNPFTRWAGRIGTAVTDRVLSVCDRISSQDSELSIEHERGVPATQLAVLYRRHIPETLHVRQDEAFYRWRFESPEWHAETYIAKQGGGACCCRRHSYPDSIQ